MVPSPKSRLGAYSNNGRIRVNIQNALAAAAATSSSRRRIEISTIVAT